MKYVTEPKPKAPMLLDKYIGFTLDEMDLVGEAITKTLAKQLVEESGLTKKDCLKSQMESDFESETMLEFINSIFPVVDDKHCSQCKHYEVCANCTMYCRVLQKRITARKKPCKHYKMKNGI